MSSHIPIRTARGFTLLEMVISLGIFVLLCAAVFGIMTSVLGAASTLQDFENHRDQTVALNAFLKESFGNLPGNSVIVSYRRGDGEGLTNNGVILGQGADLSAVDAKLQANGYYTLRVAHAPPDSQNSVSQPDPLYSFQSAVQSDDPSITWTPLIHDLSHVDWKFQDASATQWVTEWDEAHRRPTLVELSIQQAGDLQSAVTDIWLPNLLPPFITQPIALPPSTSPATAPPTGLPPTAPPTGAPPGLPPTAPPTGLPPTLPNPQPR